MDQIALTHFLVHGNFCFGIHARIISHVLQLVLNFVHHVVLEVLLILLGMLDLLLNRHVERVQIIVALVYTISNAVVVRVL